MSDSGAKHTTGAPRYSRFEADVNAMQRDSGTYCDEPEDEDDFAQWLEAFDLAQRKPAIDKIVQVSCFISAP